MPIKPATSERELIDQFLTALRAVPEVRVQRRDEVMVTAEWRCDAWIDLSVAGKAVGLFVEAKKSFYPRDVREVLWHLRALAHQANQKPNAPELVPVVVAEAISPGAKELLRKERVGYYDSGGSLFLPAPNIYVYVDKPPPRTFARSIRSLFSGRRAQVLHALLLRHEHWFGVGALAELASASPATVSELLIELERFDWMEARGRGPKKERRLAKPDVLLDEWARHLAVTRRPAIRRYYVPRVDAAELVGMAAAALGAHGVEYAITGEAAGQHYAPFLSHLSRVHCRVPMGPAVEDTLGKLGARDVDEGTNLVVIESRLPGELSFRELANGIWFASPVQVYLDLLRTEGRAKELAQHLRAERIGFWRRNLRLAPAIPSGKR